MNLCWLWYVDVPEIQSFLEQPETIAQIGHWINTPGSAEPFENACVSFAFRSLQEIIEGPEHFVAAHTGTLRVGIKIMPCIFLDHFFKALAGSSLDETAIDEIWRVDVDVGG